MGQERLANGRFAQDISSLLPPVLSRCDVSKHLAGPWGATGVDIDSSKNTRYLHRVTGIREQESPRRNHLLFCQKLPHIEQLCEAGPTPPDLNKRSKSTSHRLLTAGIVLTTRKHRANSRRVPACKSDNEKQPLFLLLDRRQTQPLLS